MGQAGNYLNDLAAHIHKTATDHGFWPPEGRNFGEMIALAHSELSEALEEHRSERPAFWIKHEKTCSGGYEHGVCTCEGQPKPEGAATELVDCIIRCLDTLNSLGVDIDDLVDEKMRYNEQRPHKHGRSY
jgi:hypothetical protein